MSAGVGDWLGWVAGVLLYPGLVFLGAFCLLADWLYRALKPYIAPRLFRGHAGRLASLLQPLYDALKAGGQNGSRTLIQTSAVELNSGNYARVAALLGLVATLLAVVLLPVPGSFTGGVLGSGADLFTVLALLAVTPVLSNWVAILPGGAGALRASRALGGLLLALLPLLLCIAALVEVSGRHTLAIRSLLSAPESAAQTFVRLLAAGVLLVCLPWWIGRGHPGDRLLYMGRLLLRGALAILWSLIVLPGAGEPVWAFFILVLGGLFAYTAMRFVEERWVPARGEAAGAQLAWATALPLAGLALVVSLLWGV